MWKIINNKMIRYGIVLILCVYTAQSMSPCACTREYNPVCASDGVTYGNPCMFRCARARSPRQLTGRPGPCRTRRDTASTATCACPRNYAPVCANDGKTYPNECVFSCKRDKSNAILQVLYPGVCQTQKTSCICPYIYSPVCGSDGNTYPNECGLNCARNQNPTLRLRVVSSGKCERDNIILQPCICSFIYKPVCGTDGKTYPNACSLNCERNKNPALAIRNEGECQNQNVPLCACSRIYKPVCGSNGQTFSSLCDLNCAVERNPSLSLAHQGECQRFVKRDVPLDCKCDRIYDPVCGDNEQSYGNECLMKCHAKESGQEIQMRHSGRCDGSKLTPPPGVYEGN